MDFHKEYIDKFFGILQEILYNELKQGNTIKEAFCGNWPYPNITGIILSKPFITPIKKDLSGIVFKNVNNPHYWKAEYLDEKSGLLLACSFDNIPDFTPM